MSKLFFEMGRELNISRNNAIKAPAYDVLLRLHTVFLHPHMGYQFLNP
jgi:hypothetical protein